MIHVLLGTCLLKAVVPTELELCEAGTTAFHLALWPELRVWYPAASGCFSNSVKQSGQHCLAQTAAGPPEDAEAGRTASCRAAPLAWVLRKCALNSVQLQHLSLWPEGEPPARRFSQNCA